VHEDFDPSPNNYPEPMYTCLMLVVASWK
jgi:hypothetical protein